MVLSLLACLVVVVPVWYLAQPPSSDSKAIRPVDPSSDVRAFQAVAPGVPVPTGVPAGWTATSSTLEGTNLRIGYVTPGDGYVEYAAQKGDGSAFVTEQTGHGTAGSTLRVGSRAFRVWSAAGDHTSLVLSGSSGTVVVGGLRETADDEQLTALAGTLR
jgi:hypothetical protein